MPRKKTKPLTLKQLIDELLKRYDGNDNKTVEISWESDNREINPGDICQVKSVWNGVDGVFIDIVKED